MNDDAQALAWYRATFDDDQTSDEMVLQRLDAWERGQSFGPFAQGVPERKGARTGRVALLVDVLGSEHTDTDMPVQDWRHLDGRLVTDAEAEMIQRTPIRDFETAVDLIGAEADMYRQRSDDAQRFLELLRPYRRSDRTLVEDVLPLLPPEQRAEAEELWDRIAPGGYLHLRNDGA